MEPWFGKSFCYTMLQYWAQNLSKISFMLGVKGVVHANRDLWNINFIYCWLQAVIPAKQLFIKILLKKIDQLNTQLLAKTFMSDCHYPFNFPCVANWSLHLIVFFVNIWVPRLSCVTWFYVSIWNLSCNIFLAKLRKASQCGINIIIVLYFE